MTNPPPRGFCPLQGPSSFSVRASMKVLISLHGFSVRWVSIRGVTPARVPGTPSLATLEMFSCGKESGRIQPGLEGCLLPGSPALELAGAAGAARKAALLQPCRAPVLLACAKSQAVCLCVCVSVRVRAHAACAHVHSCVYAYVHACLRVCMRASMRACVCVSACVRVCICVHAWLHVCMHDFMHVCVCEHECTHVCACVCLCTLTCSHHHAGPACEPRFPKGCRGDTAGAPVPSWMLHATCPYPGARSRGCGAEGSRRASRRCCGALGARGRT